MKNNSAQNYSLNLNIRGLQPSATLRINERSNQLLAEGRQVFKLGLGQSPFPVPDAVVQALQDNAHQKDYLAVKGLYVLRETVADYQQRFQKTEYTAEDVLVGPGSKELMFILQLAYYGDLVLPRPCWVSYAPQAQIIGRQIHWIDTTIDSNWQLTPESLDDFCRTDPTRPRVLILNYPSNPTGCSYSSEQLQALAEVARKYKLILLSDEIYGELNFEAGHHSIARYYPEGTIISTGLSKWCGAGGWRLGVFIFPEQLRWLLDAMAVIASETYTSTSAPIQYAAITAFQGGQEIDEYLNRSRRALKGLGQILTQRLRKMHLELADPEGGFYLLPSFEFYRDRLRRHGIDNSNKLAEALLEDIGFAALPGSDFGLPPEALLLRLAYVDFDGTQVLAAASDDQSIDEVFIRRYCERVMQAIDSLEKWLNEL